MLIYFAHPIVTYGSQIEIEAVEAIQAKFPNAEIYNPAEHPSDDMNFYFQQVQGADIIVFMPTVEGIIGKGVFDEVHLAQYCRKPVWCYNSHNHQFSLHFSIKPLGEDDWTNYATARDAILNGNKIAIIDTETTGLDVNSARILEIAIISLDYHTLEYTTLFDSVCNPGLPREELENSWICQKGFMTPDEILNAPDDSAVAKDFRRILGKLPWTTYNLKFDSQILSRKPWDVTNNKLPCIMVAAKPACAIPDPDYGLKFPSLVEASDMLVEPSTGSHRALSDAREATEVLIYLIKHGYYALAFE